MRMRTGSSSPSAFYLGGWGVPTGRTGVLQTSFKNYRAISASDLVMRESNSTDLVGIYCPSALVAEL